MFWTQTVMVRVGLLLLHKDDMNIVLLIAIVPCSVYHDTPVRLCIIPALEITGYMRNIG